MILDTKILPATTPTLHAIILALIADSLTGARTTRFIADECCMTPAQIVPVLASIRRAGYIRGAAENDEYGRPQHALTDDGQRFLDSLEAAAAAEAI